MCPQEKATSTSSSLNPFHHLPGVEGLPGEEEERLAVLGLEAEVLHHRQQGDSPQPQRTIEEMLLDLDQIRQGLDLLEERRRNRQILQRPDSILLRQEQLHQNRINRWEQLIRRQELEADRRERRSWLGAVASGLRRGITRFNQGIDRGAARLRRFLTRDD